MRVTLNCVYRVSKQKTSFYFSFKKKNLGFDQIVNFELRDTDLIYIALKVIFNVLNVD